MGEENETGGSIVVTIKSDKGYDAPWQVFRGPDVATVRASMLDYFGLSADGFGDQPLNFLTAHCAQLAKGALDASTKLGARPAPVDIKSSTTTRTNPPAAGSSDEAQAEDPWAQAKGAPADDPHAAIYDAIAAAQTVADVKTVYAKNTEAMTSDAKLKAAWSERGKELKAAGA